MRSLSIIAVSVLFASIGCRQRDYNSSNVKEVSAYSDDYTTRVPVESIMIRGAVALPLIKNIKFDKVNHEPNNVDRYWLTLSKDAMMSCHVAKDPAPSKDTWQEGCNIAVFSDASDVKSVPCDEACQKSNLMFATSAVPGARYQKVSLVGFDNTDAETLFGAMKVSEETLNSGIPGFFNDIPGKMISNIPRLTGTDADANIELPEQIFSLMCGRKVTGSTAETRCMLFTSKAI